jgi:hypothetical protein
MHSAGGVEGQYALAERGVVDARGPFSADGRKPTDGRDMTPMETGSYVTISKSIVRDTVWVWYSLSHIRGEDRDLILPLLAMLMLDVSKATLRC